MFVLFVTVTAVLLLWTTFAREAEVTEEEESEEESVQVRQPSSLHR